MKDFARKLLLLLGGAALACSVACSMSHDEVQAAIEKTLDGIEGVSNDVEVTLDAFNEFCEAHTKFKPCSDERGVKIRAYLAVAPATVGQLKLLVGWK
jgi:hypothetical protein